MKLKNTSKTILCAAALLSACSQGNRVEPERSYIQDFSSEIGSGNASLISPLVSSIDDAMTPSACERLDELRSELRSSSDSLAGKFSYFSDLFWDKDGMKAALAIEESPFTQLFLGEKFQVDDEETFYQKAKAEREAGNIGWMKWMIVKVLKAIGSIKMVQYSATNDKLEENFPGIFGEAVKGEGSLNWKVANRATDLSRIRKDELREILTSRVQLFPGNGSWQEYADSTRISLAAAAKAYRDGADGKEKLCALVLLQQNFAQLLRVKGHYAPVSLAYSRGGPNASIQKLSSNNPSFQRREVYGAFYDVLAKKSVVLENESIKNYNPSEKLISVIPSVPNGFPVFGAGKLSDAMALMEALLHSYEATSPAAPWVKTDADYLLGDILASERALLPSEAHALALGLLTVHFKNLAALHIKKVDQQGKGLAPGGTAAGILLASERKSPNVFHVSLADTMRFARIVFYLDNALKQFGRKNPEEWAALNNTYDLKTLASLFGTTVFSKEQLEEMYLKKEDIEHYCGAEDECMRKELAARQATVANLLAGNSLRDNLKALKLPLAMLLAQLGTSPSGCISDLEWDLSSGARVPGLECSVEERNELADLFTVMARDTRAAILLKKAAELRR